MIPNDEYVNFSDLSVIVTPLEQAGPNTPPASQLFHQLMHLVYAQLTLIIDEGILIRGAVTIGEVVKSWRQVFGPALIEAYRLENEEAVHPRIIVDPKIFEVLEGLPGAWYHGEPTDREALDGIITKDRDGWLFVDYLRAVSGEFDDPSEFPVWRRQHRRLITDRLKRYVNRRKIRAKYEWLDQYHKDTVRRLRRSAG